MLNESFAKVAHLIPDYQWTTIIKNGDLIHIPTKITVSYDTDGYYMTQSQGSIPMYSLDTGDFERRINDPSLAVSAFVLAVITELLQEKL